MDDVDVQERSGFFGRVASMFARSEMDEEVDAASGRGGTGLQLKSTYRYTVTVRRFITSFEDAMAAANGLKSGEQQILNLAGTDAQTRQKIVDFMCGVNFAQEGTWEEIGENIYLIVPAHAYVEVIPNTARSSALRN